MTRTNAISTQNSFIAGLKTEFTGLNFPENACTETDNCIFDPMGKVSRRRGFDKEENGVNRTITRTNKAISSFQWSNAGGDGNTEVYVLQIGDNLYFYRSSTATISNPVSNQLLSIINLDAFMIDGGTAPDEFECQYSEGNGYLFVFHPRLDPIYCTYASGTVTANSIIVRIRDFSGVLEEIDDSVRPPTTLTDEHKYNLQNQGWTAGASWSAHAIDGFPQMSTGVQTFGVAAGLLTPTTGDLVIIKGYQNFASGRIQIVQKGGTIVSYAGTALQINVTSAQKLHNVIFSNTVDWDIIPVNTDYITEWFGDVGNYPSNSDVWWLYKNSSDIFDPATTIDNVTAGFGPAPKGHYILSAFDQNRASVSGIAAITNLTTLIRPKTGAWFAGRIWYSGVDASFPSSGNMPDATWTENIYFSQIVENVKQFGRCYQTNDPTSEDRFDLLPSDGGVIRIQGAGSIYKLFPIQNGLLVFAANGIWFITGSQGIGFTANDYTIVKISGVQNISGTSFVSVLGYPMFWNSESIYTVSPGQQGNLSVESVGVEILSFLDEIPLSSKKFVRGDFDPLDHLVKWVFKSTEETDITSRYNFDRVLNFNIRTKAFYPWTVGEGYNLHDVKFVESPGGSAAPNPVFKYVSSSGSVFIFAEEYKEDNIDWSLVEYESFFATGYALRGKGLNKFQENYINIFLQNDAEESSFKIQGQWNYAINEGSGRWSDEQVFTIGADNFSYRPKRVKIRGHGLVCQFRVTNNSTLPFTVIGWSVFESGNKWI